MADGSTHTQPLRNHHARAQAHAYLPRLATAGLTPEIVALTNHGVVTRRGQPFREWWPRASAPALAAMRSRVLDLIRKVHALGICHRDLHDGNLILRRADRPLVIDMELACDVDPLGPCYDLLGPTAVVPVPAAHLSVGGAFAQGVWWGSNLRGSGYSCTALGEIFGPLQSASFPSPMGEADAR